MVTRKQPALLLAVLLTFAAGCGSVGEGVFTVPALGDAFAGGFGPTATTRSRASSTATEVASATQPPLSPTPTSTQPPTGTPTPTEVAFGVGEEITIDFLRDVEISGSQITFEEELSPTFYYDRHLVSYLSEGNRIYGLLTIPTSERPEGGYKAIVFNHGYIPPNQYETTERYSAHVDHLARNGFVVFKIDYRGHGDSEGEATGSYFSPGYTIDSIAALKSLQTLDLVDPQGIGMWGHSMAGNLTLRAMLMEPQVRAGVIWAGAVYSYDDLSEYGIDDFTYQTPEPEEGSDRRRRSREIFETHGRPDAQVEYWRAVSLTENIEHLSSPVQIHHAEDDPVVSIAYSEGLVGALQEAGKPYEFYRYEGGGHNLFSPFFDRAMRRTVAFFREHL